MSAERIAAYWRTRAQRLRLEGEICPNPDCQKPIFPPRDICPECKTNTLTGERNPYNIQNSVEESRNTGPSQNTGPKDNFSKRGVCES